MENEVSSTFSPSLDSVIDYSAFEIYVAFVINVVSGFLPCFPSFLDLVVRELDQNIFLVSFQCYLIMVQYAIL